MILLDVEEVVMLDVVVAVVEVEVIVVVVVVDEDIVVLEEMELVVLDVVVVSVVVVELTVLVVVTVVVVEDTVDVLETVLVDVSVPVVVVEVHSPHFTGHRLRNVSPSESACMQMETSALLHESSGSGAQSLLVPVAWPAPIGESTVSATNVW